MTTPHSACLQGFGGGSPTPLKAVLGDSDSIDMRVVRGPAGPVLVDASNHAALLVLAAQGHGTLTAALLGSVTQYCLRQALCPVVVVRPIAR